MARRGAEREGGREGRKEGSPVDELTAAEAAAVAREESEWREGGREGGREGRAGGSLICRSQFRQSAWAAAAAAAAADGVRRTAGADDRLLTLPPSRPLLPLPLPRGERLGGRPLSPKIRVQPSGGREGGR